MKRQHQLLSVLSTGALLAALAACGGSADPESAPESGNANPTNTNAAPDAGTSAPWILGTTDVITALDPAGAYDIGSWNLQYSLFEQLLTIPAGDSTPAPDAADSCDYTDATTVTCKLRAGDTFANGDALTSSDVKFSFERNIAIAAPNGASTLLGSISNGDADKPALAKGAIETPDDTTVVFHLNQPDQTFVKVLTTAAASIVDEDVFPADKLLGDSQVMDAVSGPYTLKQYVPKQQAVLEANTSYTGARTGKANQVIVKFYSDPSALKADIGSGQVDVAWRTLSPTDLADLSSSGDAQVLQGDGSEFRYWVWDFRTDAGKQAAVRQAAAYLIDRDAITKNAYDGTTTPAYSIVPPGFAGQKESFKTMYGATPDVAAAKKLLDDAGVSTPVSITMGFPPDHYGPNAVDEATEFSQELNDSGLFKVDVKSTEYEQYQTDYKADAYDLFMLGWYPDFLDADNYLSPFLRDGGFYANGYQSDEVNSLLDKELGETDAKARADDFGQLQDIVAKDVPIIPSWNGKNTAVATDQMTGVKETLDPTYIFRIWAISKNG